VTINSPRSFKGSIYFLISMNDFVNNYNRLNNQLEKKFMPNGNESYSYQNYFFIMIDKNKRYRFDNSIIETDSDITFNSSYAIIIEARKTKVIKQNKKGGGVIENKITRTRQTAIIGYEINKNREIEVLQIQNARNRYIELKKLNLEIALMNELVKFGLMIRANKIIIPNPRNIEGLENNISQSGNVEEFLQKNYTKYIKAMKGFDFKRINQDNSFHFELKLL